MGLFPYTDEADTTQNLSTMYALINNGEVSEVNETGFFAEPNNGAIIQLNKNHLFYLDGGAIVIGELSEVNDSEYEIFTDECTYQLSEVDYWQPIGEWLSF